MRNALLLAALLLIAASISPVAATTEVQPKEYEMIVGIGTPVQGRMTACVKQEDLDEIIEAGQTSKEASDRAFAKKPGCDTLVIHAFLLTKIRKFQSGSGAWFWELGAGKRDGTVLFYVAFPAAQFNESH